MSRVRLLTMVASAALLAVASLALAAPASADARDCPAGKSCLWKDTSYKTAGSGTNFRGFSQYMENYRQFSWTSGAGVLNDNVTSVYSNANVENSRYYQDWFGGGSYFTLPKRTGDSSLADATGAGGSGHNDWISSSYFASFYP